MLLSTVIINYKTSQLTKNSVESVRRALGKDAQIIVVDNDSGEEELKSLKELGTSIKLIASRKNLGFAMGCNLGAKDASGDMVLFLNSDAQVKQGLLEMANRLKEKKDFAVAGGKIESENGIIERSAGKFLSLGNLFILMLLGGERLGIVRFAPNKETKVDWVSGGFMMVKKTAFDKISGFDKDYFMYVEDMDLCFRLKELGFSTFYYPDALALHQKHSSSSRGFAILNIYKSILTFYNKNKSGLEYTIAKTLLYLKAIFVFWIGTLTGRRELTQTYREVLKLF